MQSVPEEAAVPPVLVPSLKQQDLVGLKRDIPCFFGHMTNAKEEWWRAMLEDTNRLIQNPVNPPWHLQCLLRAQHTNGGESDLENAVPAIVEQMREKEEAPLNEVNNIDFSENYARLSKDWTGHFRLRATVHGLRITRKGVTLGVNITNFRESSMRCSCIRRCSLVCI